VIRGAAKEDVITQMVNYMKGCGTLIRNTDKESSKQLVVTYTLGSSRVDNITASEWKPDEMVRNITADTTKAKNTDSEHSNMRMDLSTQVKSNRMRCMVKEHMNGPMAENMKVNGPKTRCMDVEPSLGKTVGHMQAHMWLTRKPV